MTTPRWAMIDDSMPCSIRTSVTPTSHEYSRSIIPVSIPHLAAETGGVIPLRQDNAYIFHHALVFVVEDVAVDDEITDVTLITAAQYKRIYATGI